MQIKRTTKTFFVTYNRCYIVVLYTNSKLKVNDVLENDSY